MCARKCLCGALCVTSLHPQLMEVFQMAIVIKKVKLQSRGHMPCFHDITSEVKTIVAESGIKNGLVTVFSHHTTCSVILQEASHDVNYFGREFLQVDLIEVMERLIPTCRTEGQ